MDVQILPLVPEAVVPLASPARTRSTVPHGYGTQEQCLPFTAAAALGLLVRSPLSFGLCRHEDVPPAAHSFRSPLDGNPTDTDADSRVFYVVDDPACHFSGNAFTFATIKSPERGTYAPIAPGVSFFDRDDQLDLFKLHLPYICRTREGVDTLFLSPLNRVPPFEVLSGLVETDWYANPVNLVLRKPPDSRSVHVAKGDPIAQLVFVERSHRRPDVRVVPDHARFARDLKQMMGDWQRQHALDRSAYKQLVRTQHGRVDVRPQDPGDTPR